MGYLSITYIAIMAITAIAASDVNLEFWQAAANGDQVYIDRAIADGVVNINWHNPGWENSTPIHMAAEHNHLGVMQALVKAGADYMATDDNGYTPLHWASWYGNSDSITSLIDYGAEVDSQDQYGVTPLIWATYKGYRDEAQLLLEANAKVNTATHKTYEGLEAGSTALHAAALRNKIDIAQLLLEYGADKNIQDNTGKTAALIARKRQHEHLAYIITRFIPTTNTTSATTTTATTFNIFLIVIVIAGITI